MSGFGMLDVDSGHHGCDGLKVADAAIFALFQDSHFW